MTVGAYPPIGDYGFIADCHSSALVSKSGSIDWCCMPRIDSKSCFGRILDWKRGGYCRISPGGSYEVTRRYLPGTLVLETSFRTSGGEARLLDCFTMKRGGEHQPHRQILRVVEGVAGSVDLDVELSPRFDYGAITPWVRRVGSDRYVAIGGSDGLFISGDFPLVMKRRHDLTGSAKVSQGQRFHLSMVYRKPEELDEGWEETTSAEELDERLQTTIDWWCRWSSQGEAAGPYGEHAMRSAIVLKGLSNAPTGAIAAAPTTSLPETAGGVRNWDYRYSWIRDSAFAVRSLAELGFVKEAEGFRRFIERSAAGHADQLQILYGIGGERRLMEYEIEELEGYRGAKPVRVGNAAEKQVQLDVYGEILSLSYLWHGRGAPPDDDYWEFLVELVNKAGSCWDEPDRGIWEIRGAPRHFVQSKAMCWAALDYGIRLAERFNRNAPLEQWNQARRKVRHAVESRGYDPNRGVFIQAFDYPNMDAALLLLPTIGFLAYDDDRMIRTTDAIRNDLGENGLLRRYAPDGDGMEGTEGVFLPCSFWLAECLARQGRSDDAHQVLQRAMSTGNDLCLFSEEYDAEHEEMLGNFPQALTHLSLITATVALMEVEKG